MGPPTTADHKNGNSAEWPKKAHAGSRTLSILLQRFGFLYYLLLLFPRKIFFSSLWRLHHRYSAACCFSPSCGIFYLLFSRMLLSLFHSSWPSSVALFALPLHSLQTEAAWRANLTHVACLPQRNLLLLGLRLPAVQICFQIGGFCCCGCCVSVHQFTSSSLLSSTIVWWVPRG